MLYYYKAMPLTKTAAAFSSYRLPGFMRLGLSRLGNALKHNAIGMAGVAAGSLGGAWLGNKAYNNAIPPVRELPGVEQRPQIGVWQPEQNWRRLNEYADY